MSNHPSSDPNNYPLHILHIKLWEWEGIKENADCQINRHGPEQTMCEAFETATARIKELQEAITILKTHQP